MLRSGRSTGQLRRRVLAQVLERERAQYGAKSSDLFPEFGAGFAFVERQKRIMLDEDDHYVDLRFFHRRRRRLVAIELKIGDFKASDSGQIELYLRWLDRHER